MSGFEEKRGERHGKQTLPDRAFAADQDPQRQVGGRHKNEEKVGAHGKRASLAKSMRMPAVRLVAGGRICEQCRGAGNF